MRQFELAPLCRSAVGSDRIVSLLASAVHQTQSCPPDKIGRAGDDTCRIAMGVAGFTEDELSVEVREGAVSVTGTKADAGVHPSMGPVGDAYDNAMCESCFPTLECEPSTGAGSARRPRRLSLSS